MSSDEDAPVGIDGAALEGEFTDYPGVLSHWGARYAEAISASAEAEESAKDIEAEVFLELQAGKQKGQTVDTIKAALRLDRRVQMARSLAMQADARRVRYQHKVMAALYAKKEMLISLGAHRRAELGGDPLVRRAIREERRSDPDLDAAVARAIDHSNQT